MEETGEHRDSRKGDVPPVESFAEDPRIVAMVCTYCTYTAADMAGSMRLQYPSSVRVVQLPCTGRIDVVHILKTFEAGADAVLVGG